jgi:ubiquinol-cytochrome c reductase cytochrome b subunit
LPGGEFIEVHQPVDEYERWKLTSHETFEPLVVRPNAHGQIPWHQNLRSAVSRWFFEDRFAPLTQSEIDAAVAHQHHALGHIEDEEMAEIQGAHERAGNPEAALHADTTGNVPETAVRPTTIVAPDEPEEDGKKK